MGLLFEFTFARRQTRTHVEIFFECGSTKFLKTYTDIALNWMNSRCESRIQPKVFYTVDENGKGCFHGLRDWRSANEINAIGS
jgi:hypothetical protein